MYKIFLDSSVIVAYVLSSDSHHDDVFSLLDFVKNKYINPYNIKNVFVVNDIVVLEAISILIREGYSTRKAIEEIQNLFKKYKIKVINRGGDGFLRTASKLYKEFSRRKFRKLKCNDFIIMADTIKSKSLLATCDTDFQKSLPNNSRDVYYISSRSKKYKDQFHELLDRFFKSL